MENKYIKGEVLRKARVEKGMTQFALYKLCGIHQTKISLYENSTRVLISNQHIKILMEILEINQIELVQDEYNSKILILPEHEDLKSKLIDVLNDAFRSRIYTNVPQNEIDNRVQMTIDITLQIVDNLYNRIIGEVNNDKLNKYINRSLYSYLIQNITSIDKATTKFTFSVFREYLIKSLDYDKISRKIIINTLNDIATKISE